VTGGRGDDVTGESEAPAGESGAWEEYLAAARRLDAVRRNAANVAGGHAQAARAADEELAAVRARLAPRRSWLRTLGVPEEELLPAQPEVAEAARRTAGGPEAVLVALRQAQLTVDAADAALAGTGPTPLRWASRLAGPLRLATSWWREPLRRTAGSWREPLRRAASETPDWISRWPWRRRR
jgi:hypothetical protein